MIYTLQYLELEAKQLLEDKEKKVRAEELLERIADIKFLIRELGI